MTVSPDNLSPHRHLKSSPSCPPGLWDHSSSAVTSKAFTSPGLARSASPLLLALPLEPLHLNLPGQTLIWHHLLAPGYLALLVDPLSDTVWLWTLGPTPARPPLHLAQSLPHLCQRKEPERVVVLLDLKNANSWKLYVRRLSICNLQLTGQWIPSHRLGRKHTSFHLGVPPTGTYCVSKVWNCTCLKGSKWGEVLGQQLPICSVFLVPGPLQQWGEEPSTPMDARS